MSYGTGANNGGKGVSRRVSAGQNQGAAEHADRRLAGLDRGAGPFSFTLQGKGERPGRVVPVHLHAKVTEFGQLKDSCRSRDGAESCKLEFNVREK